MLKTRAEFLRVARERRKAAMPGLVLQAARWPRAQRAVGSATIRVGYTASRKVGNAVARNRARRRLRAAVAAVLPRAQGRTDYVVIARKGTLTRPFPALTGDLETALRRLNALGAGRPADQTPS